MIKVSFVLTCFLVKFMLGSYLELMLFFLTKSLKKMRNDVFYLKLKALFVLKIKGHPLSSSFEEASFIFNFSDVINVLPYIERYVFLNISETIRNIYLKLGQLVGTDYMYILGISMGNFSRYYFYGLLMD